MQKKLSSAKEGGSKPLITVSVSGGLLLDRAGLEALLEQLPGLCVVALDSDPPPQVLIWNPAPGTNQDLPDLPPGTALLILVPDEKPPALPAIAGVGAVVGLFSKSESPQALSIAIRQMARGEAYLSPSLALAQRQQGQTASIGSLTDREREVLALLAEGLSNKAIAARLYLSVRTVEGHLANLYSRLGIHSRTEAMRFAIQHNLASPNK
jgi:DNA-binding NarL/FixJ family response regulator